MRLFGFASCLVGIAGLSALSCSDPVAPPAQGAMGINVTTKPPSPAGVCNIKAHNAQIGANPPTSSAPGDRVIDGQDGAAVRCSVSGSGAFSISGSLSQGPTSFQISGSFNGTTGTGTAAEYDPENGQFLSSKPDDCTITVAPPQEIASGRIWADFKCASFFNESVPSTTQCAATGHFVFENCAE